MELKSIFMCVFIISVSQKWVKLNRGRAVYFQNRAIAKCLRGKCVQLQYASSVSQFSACIVSRNTVDIFLPDCLELTGSYLCGYHLYYG